jgi:integrase
MQESTTKAVASKPNKPHPDFPLFPHATRRWAKKVKGKLHYFGPWDDPQAALKKWLDQKDDLLAGRTPRPTGGVTVGHLVNRFLTAKKHLVDTSELTPRSFADYYRTGKLVADVFGGRRSVADLSAADFEKLRKTISKTRGPVALGNEITRIRVMFKYAYDADLIPAPVRFGPTFKKPNRLALRKAKNAAGLRMFEAAELRKLLAAAGIPLKAMLLLAANCGYGNNDVGTLPLSALDLKAGWIDFPRPKTAIHRRCWLWPETVAALKAAIEKRPKAIDKAHDGLVFLTRCGAPWSKIADLRIECDGDTFTVKNSRANPVSRETASALKAAGIDRPGLNFYALRHTFETIGGEGRDQVAVGAIMGHVDASMAGTYRERISDDRLRAVAEHVRSWLLTADRGEQSEPEGGWTFEPEAMT